MNDTGESDRNIDGNLAAFAKANQQAQEADISACRKIPGFEDGPLSERLERFAVWHKQQLQAHQTALKEAKVALEECKSFLVLLRTIPVDEFARMSVPIAIDKLLTTINSVLESKGDE